ncbi:MULTISPECIES: ABC transporter substrate-binding protein [unclassified Streptomyces]|uniref:ABC transporter substrate-binding protein n=1 Tax=unclassified Streptomyces TaxID=2593676 RepID=UPI0022718782|nr:MULTISPECIES: ABC transporter substrate-binding protein [unclassified Streptomyces]MCY0916735.1 ABC transporter substrate-binding protein [Streptomyces sp. H27-G5]MCY0959039.1 ABC transporter substrate-binding protein [Streptomyces sp. H27-H5]
MPKSRSSLLTRRGLIAAGGALGLVAALSACGADTAKDGAGEADKAAAASGPWTFKDDLGKDVSAKSTPKNIVAFTGTAAALHDYGVSVKGVFGPTKTADGKPDVQAGSMDISKVQILGNVYDEFNVEKYASLQPDLLVTNSWDGSYWYVPEASKGKIMKLAPAAAIKVGGDVSMDKALARTADLAKALGADMSAKKTVDAKARFEAASAKVREATKANPGIKVLVGSGAADLFYVSTPKTSADLKYFESLGVEFVTPDKLDEGGFFESLGWENAGKYKADLVLLDNRTGTLQPKDLAAKPTWTRMPAVKAGQITPRVTEPIFSYEKCAQLLEDLAKAIQGAKKVS